MPLYRFNTGGFHFYTSSEAERTYILGNIPDWVLEGIAYFVWVGPSPDTLPVYRFNTGVYYFYTISEDEKNYVLQNFTSWVLEGVAFRTYPRSAPQTSPVYRFNTGGYHFYTISESEKNYVLQNFPSWTLEGIAYHARTTKAPIECTGYSVVDLGDLHFDGARIETSHVTGSDVVIGRIVVPDPLPSGWAGATTSVAAFDFDDPARAKKLYLARSACDFTAEYPAYGEGISTLVYMNFGGSSPSAVTVQPGEVWYVNIKNERSAGEPSCAEGASCNFAVTLYPPN